jgi:hypothetical protein
VEKQQLLAKAEAEAEGDDDHPGLIPDSVVLPKAEL